jgi:hypothetical protein
MNLFLRNLIFILLCFSRATHAASPYDIQLIGDLVVINTTNKPVYIPVGDTDWQEVANNEKITANICGIPGLMFSLVLVHSNDLVTLMFKPSREKPDILAGIIFFTVDGKDQFCFLTTYYKRPASGPRYKDQVALVEKKLHTERKLILNGK